jgi:predicted nucleotidyltransferase
VLVRTSLQANEFRLNPDHILSNELADLVAKEGSLRQELIAFLATSIRTEVPAAEEAYVYGSAVWGQMGPESDIDVAVVLSMESEPTLAEASLEHLAEELKGSVRHSDQCPRGPPGARRHQESLAPVEANP